MDSPPTVADLERDVNEGKSISILELAEAVERESKEQKKPTPEKVAKERTSLLAKLNRPLPPQSEKTQSKSKEKEI